MRTKKNEQKKKKINEKNSMKTKKQVELEHAPSRPRIFQVHTMYQNTYIDKLLRLLR